MGKTVKFKRGESEKEVADKKRALRDARTNRKTERQYDEE